MGSNNEEMLGELKVEGPIYPVTYYIGAIFVVLCWLSFFVLIWLIMLVPCVDESMVARWYTVIFPAAALCGMAGMASLERKIFFDGK